MIYLFGFLYLTGAAFTLGLVDRKYYTFRKISGVLSMMVFWPFVLAYVCGRAFTKDLE